jgi:hypothetical protein
MPSAHAGFRSFNHHAVLPFSDQITGGRKKASSDGTLMAGAAQGPAAITGSRGSRRKLAFRSCEVFVSPFSARVGGGSKRAAVAPKCKMGRTA